MSHLKNDNIWPNANMFFALKSPSAIKETEEGLKPVTMVTGQLYIF